MDDSDTIRRGYDEAAAVRRLGEAIGYGRLMQLAEVEWRAALVRHGTIPGGEFTVGPCRSTLERRGLRDCNHLLIGYDLLVEAE